MERGRWRQWQEPGAQGEDTEDAQERGGEVCQEIGPAPRQKEHMEEEEMAARCGSGGCHDAELSHPLQW